MIIGIIKTIFKDIRRYFYQLMANEKEEAKMK
jgi:hypothetical protein